MNRVRDLVKLLPDLRPAILQVPVDLAPRSVVSLQPPVDPIIAEHRVVKEILAFARTDTLESFKGVWGGRRRNRRPNKREVVNLLRGRRDSWANRRRSKGQAVWPRVE